MQIEIYSPTQGEKLPPVRWNYDELKAWITEGLEKYKGLIYTEDSITQAKKDRAALNKLAEAIACKRREKKAQYLEQYETFETKAKELEGMVKDQAAEIDAQVKAFDEARKAEKLEQIKVQYTEIMGELAKLVPYEKIHDKKWLNVTTSMTSICTELFKKTDDIKAALESINSLGLPDDMAARVKSVYLDRLDLAAALAEKDRIEKENQALEDYEATKARNVYCAADPDAFKKAKPGDVVQFGGHGCVSADASEKVSHEAMGYAADEAPDLITVDFRVHATREQLEKLKAFLLDAGIKYGRVPTKM